MMKNKCLSIFLAAAVFIIISVITMSATTLAVSSVTYAYTDVAVGICDNHSTATVTKNVQKDGKKTLKIVPTPDGAMAKTQSIIVDAYEIDKKGFDLDKHFYVTIEYKYESTNPKFNGKMGLNIMKPKLGIDNAVYVNSYDNVKSGEWNTAVFLIGYKVKPHLTEGSHIIWQLHLYPFGGAKPSALSENDVMYIGDITFTSEIPHPDDRYLVSFDIEGASSEHLIEPVYLNDGDTYVMPECTFEMEGYQFNGWKNVLSDTMNSGYVTDSAFNKTYYPGEVITVDGADLQFYADYKSVSGLEGVKVIDYTSYYRGISDSNTNLKDICLSSEVVTSDGIKCVRAEPNPNATSGSYFAFDGWKYSNASIDTRRYKYAAIVYKFDTAKEHSNIKAQFRIINGGFKGVEVSPYSIQPLKTGKWDIVTFDLSKYSEYIDSDNPLISHIHILPFQASILRELDVGDAFYISKIILFEENPDSISMHPSFINGYDGGLFKPGDNVSIAEACTIFTRLLSSESSVKGKNTSSFSDLNGDEWYYDNVAFIESLGLLKKYGDKINADNAINKGEFSRLLYYYGLYLEGNLNKFNDNFGGGFNDEAKLSRAEAVNLINILHNKRLYKNKYISDLYGVTIYKDIEKTHWAFMDIMEASVPHAVLKTSVFGEEWMLMDMPEILESGTSAKAKLQQIDELTKIRKEEILSSVDDVTVTGTKYYVSSSGNDSNDGKSPGTAWATISKVNSTSNLRSGDAVLFNRGDCFRGNLKTVSGVTYGAYGSGDKPIISASEENGAIASNWSLVDGTTNIWIYNKKMINLGGIVAVKDGVEQILERKVVYYSQNDDKFYLNSSITSEFNIVNNLENNWIFLPQKTSNVTSEKSDVYLRCDEGNPGSVFSSLEFIDGKAHNISAKSNVTIDNLSIKYGGRHGIGAGTVNNLIVTNCEISWIGGSLQMFTKQSNGVFTPTRFGNGVEVYGGCNNFAVDNCYIYQCFDAGVTNQYQKGGTNQIVEEYVYFTNNVIENCCYNIEYFMGIADTSTVTRLMQNVIYDGNILRCAGYGFGRTNPINAAHIKGWDHYNNAENFVISNNIFDRSKGDLLHIGAQKAQWLPKLSGNTYIQYEGSLLGHIGSNPSTEYKYTGDVKSTLSTILGETSSEIYFLK